MKIQEKLRILSESAKFDASCSSSGSERKRPDGGIGNGAWSGICHSWSADGRCISLLKILLSNDCLLDCCYCLNRRSNALERATFTPKEIADLTLNFYLRNYIEGLFLSSAMYSTPDDTMADMIETCRILRERKKFGGYIHLKIIPGASNALVQQAGRYADRLSVNIELPSEASLKLLAPQKNSHSILLPMRTIAGNYIDYQRERKRYKKPPPFSPAGQTTQLIIGASPEHDCDILHLSQYLYNKLSLKRVYYSAYVGINSGPNLPVPASAPPLLREHRLYQADWLLRYYGFQAHELLTEDFPDLDERLDPKASWALRNFDLFPLDLNTASFEELLRVPGLGVLSARRIVRSRKSVVIRKEDLTKIGLVLKRAQYFITLDGRKITDRSYNHLEIHKELQRAETGKTKILRSKSKQLKLF